MTEFYYESLHRLGSKSKTKKPHRNYSIRTSTLVNYDAAFVGNFHLVSKQRQSLVTSCSEFLSPYSKFYIRNLYVKWIPATSCKTFRLDSCCINRAFLWTEVCNPSWLPRLVLLRARSIWNKTYFWVAELPRFLYEFIACRNCSEAEATCHCLFVESLKRFSVILVQVTPCINKKWIAFVWN